MSFLSDPSTIITQFYPEAPLDFDSAPTTLNTRPLKALFAILGQRLAQYNSDVLLMQSQMSVQTAAGKYLDLHGAFYGIPRMTKPTYELDDPYRQRILNGTRKLTIPAIQAVVVAYYQSTRPANAQPIVNVYDIQSNPTLAAANSLVMYQFMIDVAFPVLASTAFIAGRAFLGRHDYLVNPDGISNQPSDAALAAIVRATKAANTQPVWRTHSFLVKSFSS